MPERIDPAELRRRAEEARRAAIAAFPFQRIEAEGARAFDRWNELRRGGIVSAIVGDDEKLARLAQHLGGSNRQTSEILEVAARLNHPEGLFAARQAEAARFAELERTVLPRLRERFGAEIAAGFAASSLAAEYLSDLLANARVEVPQYAAPQDTSLADLSMLFDYQTGKPIEKANLVVFPTDDWTTIPAYLQWGGWNACPAPELHIAALRSWRDRFGAELVAITSDTLHIRVTERPETDEAAGKLAAEQYVYCNDLVDQGFGTVEALAASLLSGDWWHIWWD